MTEDGTRGPQRGGRSAAEPDHAENAEFDSVVQQLLDDPTWRSQVRRGRAKYWAALVGGWSLHCFAEVGCWFTGVPPQRYSARFGPSSSLGSGR